MLPRACRSGILGIVLATAAHITCSSDSRRPASLRWLTLCWAAALALGVGCHLGLELGLKAAGFDSRRLFIEGEDILILLTQLFVLMYSRRAAGLCSGRNWVLAGRAASQHPAVCQAMKSSQEVGADILHFQHAMLLTSSAGQRWLLLGLFLVLSACCDPSGCTVVHAPITSMLAPHLLTLPTCTSQRMAAQPGVFCGAGRGASGGGGDDVAHWRPAPAQPLCRRRCGGLRDSRPPPHRSEVSRH